MPELLAPGSRVRILIRDRNCLQGRAWLQFESYHHPADQTRLVQAAFLTPKGLSGLAYWYFLYPLHQLTFAGMIRNLAQRAVEIPMKGKNE